jgi:hypothetical protein
MWDRATWGKSPCLRADRAAKALVMTENGCNPGSVLISCWN